jgi:hypothetical protein
MNGHKQSGGQWNAALGRLIKSFQLLGLVGLFVRIVRGYFANHASRSEKRWRSISLNCAIRGKQRTTGGGPHEFPITSDSLELTYNRGIFGIVHNCTVFEITGHFSRFGNELTSVPSLEKGSSICDPLELTVFYQKYFQEPCGTTTAPSSGTVIPPVS